MPPKAAPSRSTAPSAVGIGTASPSRLGRENLGPSYAVASGSERQRMSLSSASELQVAFDLLDEHKRGALDHQQAKRWLRCAGWCLPDAELSGMLQEHARQRSKRGVAEEKWMFKQLLDVLEKNRFRENTTLKRLQQGYNKSTSVKAKTVTLPGGGMVNIQDEMDAEMLTFVGAQNLRYTGTIKFFDQIRGFGWVIIDDGFSMEEPVPKEIKVQGSELHTGGKPLRMRLDKLAVEFGIIKNRKGDGYLAYNLTLPGGTPITQETLENRQPEGGQRYTGTVQWWHRWQGWGHIAPENTSAFPAPVQQKLAEAAAQAAAKAKEGESKSEEKLLYFRKADCEWSLRPEVGKKVTFTVYTDDKGAGATEVLAAD